MNTGSQEYIRRFGVGRIAEHHVNAIIFALLVLTGLSQRFHEYGPSQWLILALGGIDMVRLIHRISGLTFTLLMAVHIVSAAAGVILKKWPPSMVITLKDFHDAIDNMKYYFGITNHPARCDRYDYKQKFEYWGVIAGGAIMALTGLILWYPTTAVQILPGEFIPAAKALHSNEGLLAFLVIITWHIYNAVFSPEVFPLDTAIFTGKITRERMVHEHPVELARLEGKSLDEIVGHGQGKPSAPERPSSPSG